MDERDVLKLVKERLIDALYLADIENIPINKLIHAYVLLKRLELNQNTDEQDSIIVRYIDELARGE